MKKILYIALPVTMLFAFSSCDWFNTTFLGKPSKAEAAKRAEEEQAARQDSLALIEMQQAMEAEQLALAEQAADEELARQAAESKRYHVVVGSFKVSANADRMMGVLQNRGYSPRMLNFKNGFTCISAASYADKRTAFSERVKIMNADFAPQGVWVYDASSALHRN